MSVFLSYAHDDAAHAQRLQEELQELVGDVWVDRGLVGGQMWWDEILSQIQKCSLFVLALSDHSLRSEACMSETSYAQLLGRPFLGVIVADHDISAAPEEIRRTQLVDFRGSDVATVRALAKATLTSAEERPLPDVMPDAPPIPMSYRDRFADIFKASLTMDDQLSLFARLKFDYENGSHPKDTAEMLVKLRDRPDLSWKVRDEISRLLVVDEPPASEAPKVQAEPTPSAATHCDVNVVKNSNFAVQLDVSMEDCRFSIVSRYGLTDAQTFFALRELQPPSFAQAPAKGVERGYQDGSRVWGALVVDLSENETRRHRVTYLEYTALLKISGWALIIDGKPVLAHGTPVPASVSEAIAKL